MFTYCPICEQDTNIEEIERKEKFVIRGKTIALDVKVFICEKGHEFDDPLSDDDYIERAYRTYREQFGYLQPEDIRKIRLSYGLTQNDLSKILGWGGATLSRYENGALQSASHDSLLKLVQNPSNLLKTVEDKKTKLPDKLVSKIRQNIQKEYDNETISMKMILEQQSKYSQNEDSGFKELNIDKLFSTIVFLLQGKNYLRPNSTS